MFINRNGNRFVASFDAAAMLRKVIENTENASLVFESIENDHSSSAAMLIDGDSDSVYETVVSMGIPCMSN